MGKETILIRKLHHLLAVLLKTWYELYIIAFGRGSVILITIVSANLIVSGNFTQINQYRST